MDKVRILHCADIHLGAKFSATPEISALRADEHFKTFEKIIHTAKSDADILLIAGDLFDKPNVDINIAKRAAELLKEATIPVFIAPGNHDPASPDSVYFNVDFSDNVHIFTDNKLSYKDISHLGVRVWGAGFVAPVQREDMIEAPELYKDMKNILVIHGDLNAEANSPYNAIDEKQLSSIGFDYVALGHVHSYYIGNKIAYSGCCEGTGFDECGPKGFINVCLTTDDLQCQFTEVCQRQYICSDFNGLELSESSLKTQLGDNYKNNIYRLNLINYQNPIEVAAFLKEKLFYVSVTDGKYVLPDYNTLAKENNLRGEFVRRMIEKINNEPQNVKVNTKALNYGITAFDREVKI